MRLCPHYSSSRRACVVQCHRAIVQAQQRLHARRIVFPVECAQHAIVVGNQQGHADRRFQPIEAEGFIRWHGAASGHLISPENNDRPPALFTARVLASTRNLKSRVGKRTMIMIANALVALVALLHVYFLILEMFLWTKPLGLKTFRQSPEKAADSAVLAANQGLYNGFLAAGLAWGLIQGNAGFAFQIKTFFLLCVIVAGIYGAATVSRRILYVQAAPAAIALILLWPAQGR